MSPTYPARVSGDAGDDGVAELAAVATLVEGLHHDGLAASVATGQKDHDLARLDAAPNHDGEKISANRGK